MSLDPDTALSVASYHAARVAAGAVIAAIDAVVAGKRYRPQRYLFNALCYLIDLASFLVSRVVLLEERGRSPSLKELGEETFSLTKDRGTCCEGCIDLRRAKSRVVMCFVF